MTNQSRVFVPVEKIAEFTLKSRAVGALVPSNISVFMDGTVAKCQISDSNYVQNNVLLYQNSSYYKFKLIYAKHKDFLRSGRATPNRVYHL